MKVTIEKIYEILNEIIPGIDFKIETKLVDSDILDSFDIATLAAELEDIFDIEITVNDLVPENFNSGLSIYELVLNRQNE